MVDPSTRGRLKVFLGYAAGVGKTFQMLTEAREVKSAAAQTWSSVISSHMAVRRRSHSSTGWRSFPDVGWNTANMFEEMDTEAILNRHPRIALVDEFPHSNVPGSPREKRWEDVDLLLDAGIDVLTTMNVQHLESLNDQIWQSTGIRVRETIPDWVVRQADEVVMVDLTPQALLNRLARGVVYSPERARAALENFFKEPTLVALRELAMRQTAHAVQSRHELDVEPPSATVDRLELAAQERLLLLITPDPSTAALIRRGRRVADYLRADCFAVCVVKRGDLEDLPGLARSSSPPPRLRARPPHRDSCPRRRRRGGDHRRFRAPHGVTQILVTRQNEGGWTILVDGRSRAADRPSRARHASNDRGESLNAARELVNHVAASQSAWTPGAREVIRHAGHDRVGPEEQRAFDQQGTLVVKEMTPPPRRHELRQHDGHVRVGPRAFAVDVLQDGSSATGTETQNDERHTMAPRLPLLGNGRRHRRTEIHEHGADIV